MDSLIVRRNVMDNMNVGLRVNNVSTNRPLQIEKNAFFNCSLSAMELEAIRGGNVYCNWLYNCSSSSIRTGALFIRDMFRTDISRNEFRKAYYGIDLGSRVDSSVHIHHNYFNTMTYGMRFGLTAGENYASFPNFNDNCLLSITSYHILMEYCFVNDKDVDATNNYWSGLSGSSIPIFDDDENSLCPVVLTSPVLSSCPRSDVGYCRD